MNAHAELFPQIPAIVKTLPDPIDQMKLFELIQIIPTPTKSALRSGNLLGYRVSDPTHHGISAQQQRLHLRTGRPGAEHRRRCREILDAMWLFNQKFEAALSEYRKVKAP